VKTLGILLAGGRGSRLGGGVAKALVPCGGRTLLERALATLAPLADEIVVVAPAAMELPVPRAQRVDDPPGEKGPLPALLAGLAARTFDEAVVMAVDMPLVTVAALSALRALRGGALAVMAAPNGLPQPLAAWYASGAQERLAAARDAGERSLIAACRTLAPAIVDDAARAKIAEGEGFEWNVNTPEELAQVERRLAARASQRAPR